VEAPLISLNIYENNCSSENFIGNDLGIQVGESKSLKIKANEECLLSGVTWSKQGNSINITDDGIISGVKSGESFLTASFSSGSDEISTSIRVYVRPGFNINGYDSDFTINALVNNDLVLTAYNTQAENDLFWNVSENTQAINTGTLSNEGKTYTIKPNKEGTLILKSIYLEKTITITIKVSDIGMDNVYNSYIISDLDPIKIGDNGQLGIVLQTKNSDQQELTYNSLSSPSFFAGKDLKFISGNSELLSITNNSQFIANKAGNVPVIAELTIKNVTYSIYKSFSISPGFSVNGNTSNFSVSYPQGVDLKLAAFLGNQVLNSVNWNITEGRGLLTKVDTNTPSELIIQANDNGLVKVQAQNEGQNIEASINFTESSIQSLAITGNDEINMNDQASY
ncbi:MAG TPA: hypothetical protein PLQ36_04165, partial [Candidatus Gracilibacteria bacterium]|nr:hypothetical protein [Candidatus Gracilibacteria bacterium]